MPGDTGVSFDFAIVFMDAKTHLTLAAVAAAMATLAQVVLASIFRAKHTNIMRAFAAN